jgi:hypothetical protein
MSAPTRIELLHEGSLRYARAYGLPLSDMDYSSVIACPVRGKRMGAAYMAAPIFDGAALPAFEAFRAETLRQFEFLTRPVRRGGLGLHVEVCTAARQS